MSGVDACYYFAGILGVSDLRDLTLRTLWRLACGRIKQRRREMIEQASLVWGLEDIDAERYLLFGEMKSTNRNGPLEMSKELESKVMDAAEELRKNNPDLPQAVELGQ